MTEIVHENGDTRLVRLNEHYYSGDDQLVQLFARFSEHTTVLSHCYSVSGKPKSFMLSTAEMEALANAWISYTNDQREKAEAEQKRLAEMEAEAYRLVANCRAVNVNPHVCTNGQTAWEVSIPSMGWAFRDWMYSLADFLDAVKTAIDVYQDSLVKQND